MPVMIYEIKLTQLKSLLSFKFRAALLQAWIWPSVLCKLAPFSTTLNTTVSTLTLVVITLDRFYVINYPFKKKLTKLNCLLIMTLIWTVGLLVSGYNIMNYEVNVYNNTRLNTTVKRCENIDEDYSKYHLFALFTIQFFIPFVILMFTFAAIYYKIYFTSWNTMAFDSSNYSLANKKKALRMILIVLFCFILSWTPLQVYNFLQIIRPDINE
jgi:hypothetical protein